MALATITDSILEADDTPPGLGSFFVVTWPRFTSSSGKTIPAGSKTVVLGEDGSFSIQLEPSDASTPPFSYLVAYHISGLRESFESWIVPTGAAVRKISELYTAGPLPIPGTSVALTAKGDLVSSTGAAVVRFPVGSNGTHLVADSTAAAGLSWVASNLPALTAKGDVMVFDGSTIQRLAAGVNGQALVADSTVAKGLKWADAAVPQAVISRTAPSKFNLVVDGDSITAGYLQTKSAASSSPCRSSLSDFTCTDWPSQLVAMSTFLGRVLSKNNFAVPGNQITQLQARYAASIHPLAPTVTGQAALLMVYIGANDYGVLTVAAMQTAYAAYIAGAKADNFTVAWFTIPKRGDDDLTGDPNGLHELARIQINEWIRAQYAAGAFDYLIDMDRFQQSPWSTTFFNVADHVHPTAAGSYLQAKFINASMWADGLMLPMTSDVNSWINQATIGGGNQRTSYNAMNNLTTGGFNTAHGWHSLQLLTTGSNNVAVGFLAGQSLTTGTQNIYIGSKTGNQNDTGSNNTVVGHWAGYYGVGNSDNTAVGAAALQTNVSGIKNTAIGSGAGGRPLGSQCTFMGYQAGFGQTGGTGAANTGVGASTLANINTGNSNTCVGAAAGGNGVANSSYNTFVGANSGSATGDGGQNTGVGGFTLSNLTTGANNTALGANAGQGLTTGAGNVALGYNAKLAPAAAGAAQIGTGTNSTNNTLQFQNITVADAAGNTYSRVSTPVTSAEVQPVGAIWTDASYIYVSTASGTIKRVALSSF